MARVLLLFAHPALEKSRIHKRLVAAVPALPRLTFQDLYEAYPDFDIDIAREQQLLLDHDVVVMQHPFFWYSTPAILKQWQDLVLEHGWAYGTKGTKLHGKKLLSVITAGGRESAYHHEGHNRHTVRELLYPLEQTVRLCGMDYLPPYMIFGTHWMMPPDIDAVAERYRALLTAIHDDRIDFARMGEVDTLNHALEQAGTDPLAQAGTDPLGASEKGTMTGGVLYQAFVYLAAAVVVVPLAKRFGLGSVLGYLIAGVLIGPYGLRLLGHQGQDVMHFAEFGVVMMLFVVGLELQPSLLWRLRAPILGMGGLQVLLTTVVVGAGAVAAGLHWKMSLALGMTLAMSSTAIVLQTLAEKQQLKTPGGQSAFAILLFQDIAVIPILAIFPMLATVQQAAGGEASHDAGTLLAHMPAWVQAIAVLAAVGIVVGGARFLLRPVFRMIAHTRLREVFTAAALLLVIGIALLMGQVGLSPALGTFLAGVVLADSEYRHELESDIDPFKGLLLGLFFIAVGATIDFGLIVARPLLVVGLVLGILAAKFAVLLALGRVFGLRRDQGLLLAFALPQVGEFAFVLFSFGNQEGVFAPAVTGPLVAAVALSMAVTPLLIVLNERVVLPRFVPREAATEREADHIDEHGSVLIAGFGSFGSTVGRLLRANGVSTTVLDHDVERVELLRRLGLKVYYGDASRHDLLVTAGAERARLLVIALDSPERTLQLVHTAKKHFPGLVIMARAFDWEDAHDLVDAGVPHVYFQSLDSSMRVGVDALRALGFRAYHSDRAARQFLKHDMESLHALGADRKVSQARYFSAARKRIEDLERRLQADRLDTGAERDMGWDAETLRDDVRRSAQNDDLPE